MLKQARDSVAAKIKENPTTIMVLRRALVDNGFGEMVENPFGEAEQHVFTVRIAHERKQVPDDGATPAGFSTNLVRFILADHKSQIKQGDRFDALGKSWEIGAVDPLVAFGGIKGYQAPLREASVSAIDPTVVTHEGWTVYHEGEVVRDAGD
jgi:hypothetical protein